MANTVRITKIEEGPQGLVLQVFLESDGASGELVDATLVDPAVDFDPVQTPKPCIHIMEVMHDLQGFSVVLEFDDLVSDTPTWVMSGNGSAKQCFRKVGGLFDRSAPLDGSGKLTMSTKGFTAAGDVGSFIITLRKS